MSRTVTGVIAIVALAACGKTTRDPPDADVKRETSPVSSVSNLPTIAPPELGIEQLELEGYRACVRASNGGIYCWGQCRYDCGETELRSSPEARLVQGVVGAKDLLIGSGFGCAIDEENDVLCWGSKGEERSAGRVSKNEAMRAEFGKPRNIHGCGCTIDAQHRLHCAANAFPGPRLPNGSSPPDRPLPCSIKEVKDVQAVAANGQRACALLTNGTVSCWGDGFYDGDASLARLPPTPIPGIKDATKIGYAARRACALGKDKKVRCWREAVIPAIAKPTAAFAADFEWDKD